MMLFTFVLSVSAVPKIDIQSLPIDEGIFQRIGAGDKKALEELYNLTERTLYGYTISLTKDHELALEIMQETYLKILSAAHLYKPMGKPLAWMFTITKNLFYSELKKKSRYDTVDPHEHHRDQRFSYVTDEEDRLVLEGVLSNLTEEEREIVLLYAVSGMKHREIAENLNMKLSTLLSKYHRALKKLRGFLEEKEGRS